MKPVQINKIQKQPEPFEGVGEEYFVQFEQKLKERIAQNADSNPEKIYLSQIPKTNIFIVPDLYFAKSREEITEQTKVRQRSIWLPSARTWTSMAASVALIGVLTWWSLPQKQTMGFEQELTNVPVNQMISFVENQNINQDDILESELGQIKTAELDSLFVTNLNLKETEILKYIEENHEVLD